MTYTLNVTFDTKSIDAIDKAKVEDDAKSHTDISGAAQAARPVEEVEAVEQDARIAAALDREAIAAELENGREVDLDGPTGQDLIGEFRDLDPFGFAGEEKDDGSGKGKGEGLPAHLQPGYGQMEDSLLEEGMAWIGKKWIEYHAESEDTSDEANDFHGGRLMPDRSKEEEKSWFEEKWDEYFGDEEPEPDCSRLPELCFDVDPEHVDGGPFRMTDYAGNLVDPTGTGNLILTEQEGGPTPVFRYTDTQAQLMLTDPERIDMVLDAVRAEQEYGMVYDALIIPVDGEGGEGRPVDGPGYGEEGFQTNFVDAAPIEVVSEYEYGV